MNPQLHIDFTVTRHNNRESEMFYEENMDRFSDQCKKVWRLLKEGERLTVYDAMVKYQIGHLPRRIKDLREAGVVIQDRFIPGQRHKEYFI